MYLLLLWLSWIMLITAITLILGGLYAVKKYWRISEEWGAAVISVGFVIFGLLLAINAVLVICILSF